MNAGTDLARDIETGFFNRLSLTPVRGIALLSGTLAGVVFAMFQAIVYLAMASRSASRSSPGSSACSCCSGSPG